MQAVGNRVLVIDPEHSRRVSDSSAVGNRVHVIQKEEQTISKYEDHEQRVHEKSFPKCEQQMRKY